MSKQTTQRRDFQDAALDRQRERLEQLKAGTEELRSLREQECGLEVELIAAEAALTIASRQGALTVSPVKAAEIIAALGRTRRLEAVLETLARRTAQGDGSPDEGARLTAGRNALQSWLAAPLAGRPPRLSAAVRGMLATAAAACILAALTVHPLMLLMLAPLLLPLAYVNWSRQNASWLRLGAERRYAATGLDPPAAWQVPDVERRVSDLERSFESLSEPSKEPADEADEEQDEAKQVAAELLQTRTLLQTALSEISLTVDELDDATEHHLGLSAQVHNAREALNSVKAQRARSLAENDADREALFRFLSRHGGAPLDGRADVQTLDASLKRLAAQSVERRGPAAK